MVRTRYRIVKKACDDQPAVWESYDVTVQRQPSSQVAAFMMQVASEEAMLFR